MANCVDAAFVLAATGVGDVGCTAAVAVGKRLDAGVLLGTQALNNKTPSANALSHWIGLRSTLCLIASLAFCRAP